MEMMARYGLLVCLSLLTGCAAANSQAELKAHPAQKYEFDLPGNYQANYKTIADTARSCLSSVFIASSMNVETDLLPDQKRGTIAIAAVQFGTQYWAAAEIVPNPTDNTHVTVWNYVHGWDYIGPRMQAWGKGDTACR